MLLFQKLITETQISEPPEPAMDHNSITLMILLPFIDIFTLDRSTMRHPVPVI